MIFPSAVTFSDLRYVPEAEPVLPVEKPIYRVLHDLEVGEVWRPNLPEVHPFAPSHFTPFAEAWQRLSYEMNTLTKNKWTAVYSHARAFTNGAGFGDPTDPRRNYIKAEDLLEPLPKVEALVCGGAVLSGTVSGANLIVDTLNGREAPPSLEWLLEHPWLMFHAVTVDSVGTPRRFPQADGGPVLIPLIADRNRYPQVTIPLAKLQRWTGDGLPDPYRIYL